jgi:hypothetical protein
MTESELHQLVHQAAYGATREERLLALSLLVKHWEKSARAWERDRGELADLRGRLASAMTDGNANLYVVPHIAARHRE